METGSCPSPFLSLLIERQASLTFCAFVRFFVWVCHSILQTFKRAGNQEAVTFLGYRPFRS
jgi:hypothetical protein